MTKGDDKLTDPAGDRLAKLDAAARGAIEEESAILSSLEQGQSLPQSPAEQAKIGDVVAQNIYNRFGLSLSPADRALWLLLNNGEDATVSPGDRTRLREAYFDFLLENVVFYGAALLRDAETARLFSNWERTRSDLIRRFGEKILERAMVLSGEKQPPITKEHGKFKRVVVPELGRLIGRFRKQRTRRSGVSNGELADWMKAEIEARPQAWPGLLRYHAEIEQFIRKNENPDFAALILNGSTTAPSFVDQWFAITRKITVPYAGQKLSGRRD